MPRYRKDGKKVINARAKGASFERTIANILKERGYDAKRQIQFGFGSHDNPDVKHSLEGLHFECKAVENLNLYKAMEQSKKDCEGTDLKPTVVHKKNRKDILITLKFDDFLDLYEEIFDNL